MSFHHIPVLLEEVVAAMQPADGEVYVDCTLGGGGHSEALLSAAACTVIGLDRDPAALEAAGARLARFGARFVPVRARFSELSGVLGRLGIPAVDGVLADIGVSSPQLDEAERGFSFSRSGPLDMRMDPSASLTAAEVVNAWPEAELVRILRDFGEEPKARRVARAIVEGRPHTDTLGLANVVASALGFVKGKHPATRTFQAIRLAVNDELSELAALLPAAVEHLRPGGRLVIISFHSLEDRLVKRFFHQESGRDAPRDPYGERVGSFRLAPPPPSQTAPENDPNPRARSARLRSAVRLPWTAP